MPRILVIDDEEKYLTLYAKVLMKAGYQVVTASSAATGIGLAVSGQPDLILLDVMMPSIDGTEALATLSENARTRHIPVIFLTSMLEEREDKDTDGQIGGRELISKSTPIDKFVARVKRALSAAPARAPTLAQ